jgi:hypothetical protein
MRHSVTVISAGFLLLGFAGDESANARTYGPAAGQHASDFSAQSRPARARTRIRVTPIYPYRLFSTPYPVPYKYEYPGPGAVRQCTSWLASENRLSGPVITPQMRCWWER